MLRIGSLAFIIQQATYAQIFYISTIPQLWTALEWFQFVTIDTTRLGLLDQLLYLVQISARHRTYSHFLDYIWQIIVYYHGSRFKWHILPSKPQSFTQRFDHTGRPIRYYFQIR